MNKEIPYKIYLEESEMPKEWYNVRADMKKKPAPILNPGTLKPITLEELSPIFCEELAKQELDDTTAYFAIPTFCNSSRAKTGKIKKEPRNNNKNDIFFIN